MSVNYNENGKISQDKESFFSGQTHVKTLSEKITESMKF